MAVLVCIPDPNSSRLNIVYAEPIGEGRYKLVEDAAPVIGYKSGDVLVQYGEAQGLPKVEKVSEP